jgi:uncharacterized protein
MSSTLVILGASVRAAALSALRSGYKPVCGDLFGDTDLRAGCPSAVVRDYPAGFEAAARSAPAGPWMYTGGLENHPDLVDRITATRPLYGNDGRVLRAVRDPALAAQRWREDGLTVPECAVRPEGVPTDGSWLRKGRRSSGGLKVDVWRGGARPEADGEWYFQQRVAGLSCGAVFLADGNRSLLLGITEQRIGLKAGGQSDFQYCGSCGPVSIGDSARQVVERLGEVVVTCFRLVGLFGIDLLIEGERVWPVEVNPRYTASVEILERALGIPAVDWHVRACRDRWLPLTIPLIADQIHGKSILFARRTVRVGEPFLQRVARLNERFDGAAVADMPALGSEIAAGSPVVTVFAAAPDLASLEIELARRQAECQAALNA